MLKDVALAGYYKVNISKKTGEKSVTITPVTRYSRVVDLAREYIAAKDAASLLAVCNVIRYTTGGGENVIDTIADAVATDWAEMSDAVNEIADAVYSNCEHSFTSQTGETRGNGSNGHATATAARKAARKVQ